VAVRDSKGRFVAGSGKPSASVRDVDKGYAALVKRVYGLATPTIEVGILDSEGSAAHGATSVLEVAIWNEFGTAGIPERSFIRAWFDENSERLHEAVRRMLEAAVAGKYAKDQALELLAQRFVAEIQKRMARGIPPPNAPSTVARKGSSTPLIDTEQLRSSISYRIKGSGGK
jgi:hypothetical protein